MMIAAAHEQRHRDNDVWRSGFGSGPQWAAPGAQAAAQPATDSGCQWAADSAQAAAQPERAASPPRPDDIETCVICKTNFQYLELVAIFRCGHRFHQQCVGTLVAHTVQDDPESTPVFPLCRQAADVVQARPHPRQSPGSSDGYMTPGSSA